MKHFLLLSILYRVASSALTNVPITVESTLGPGTVTPTLQSTTATRGAITVTVLPTQVVVENATLTRNAPGTLIGGTPVSLGSTALVIGTSTIPFATSGIAPIYTVAGQIIVAGPAGVAIAGITISNNGPAVTISGTPVSLGSFGLVIDDVSTFTIPTVVVLYALIFIVLWG